MRITTKFISQFFRAKMGAQHFSKAFFFPNNKRKTKTLFLFDYRASPRKSTRP
jgi:hypothetical protein